jgi:putative lipoic acid-binding regulatory protein
MQFGIKSKSSNTFVFPATFKVGTVPTVEETFLENIDYIIENGYPGSLNLSVSRRGGYYSYCGNGNYSQWNNYLNGIQTNWQYPSAYNMYVSSYTINVYDLVIITP